MKEEEVRSLEKRARQARLLALDAIHAAGSGHVGGVMSIMDALVVLYYRTMRVDSQHPRDPERDRFIMSKGHAGPALYAVLAMKGYFPVDVLKTLNQNGTHLPSHCDMNKVRGVDMTAGSLGQGISAAEGMALCGKLDDMDYRVFCAIGDGECQEGEVWEAALFAPQHGLDNLTVLIDANGGQVDGYVMDIEDVSPIGRKFEDFGWEVQEIDGHDIVQIAEALDGAGCREGKPHAVVLHTHKAYGLIGLEDRPDCHHVKINDELYEKLRTGLQDGGGK